MGKVHKRTYATVGTNTATYLAGKAGKYIHDKISHHFRYKHQGSQTETCKSKVEKLKGDDVHSGITDASYYLECKGNKPKGVNFSAGVVKYFEVTNYVVGASAGLQLIQDIGGMCSTNQQLIGTGTAGNLLTDSDKGATALLDMLVNRTNTGSGFLNSANRMAGDKAFVSSCKYTVSMVNLESVASSYWIYVLESKCANATLPSFTWTKAAQAEGIGMAAQYANISAGANVGGTVGYVSSVVDYFNSPFTNSEFRKSWKPLKVHRVNLAAGASEDVTFHVKMDYMIDVKNKILPMNPALTADPTTWVSGNVSIRYPRGSVAVLLVGRGQPVADNTTTSPNTTTCTYASTKLGLVTNKLYHIYPVAEGSSARDVTIGVPQIAVNTLLANQKFISVTDAAANNTVAN